jgi:hypothetical protein
LPKSEPTLAQVSETIWALRQQLTAGIAQTIVEYTPYASLLTVFSGRCPEGEPFRVEELSMSENGLRSYGFHSSDPNAAAVMDALTHERASSPAFATTGPDPSALDPETAARQYPGERHPLA